MISIIVCARKKDIPETLQQNIAETISLPYEVIVIDNSDNRYSIFQAYNLGVSRSRYPLLLFMHDDIIFHTQEWGKKLLAHFADEKVGAVGIAGTPYLAWTAGGWWSSGAGHLYLLQSAKHDPAPVMQHYFPDDSTSEEVVVLDGVWFCIRREIFRDIRFDEANFKGFHFYDVDTTLQVCLAGHRLLCIRNILIHHLSSGVLDQKWVDNALIFHEKWKDRLPVQAKEYSLSQQCHMEYRVLNEMMHTRLADGTDKASRVFSFALSQMLGFKKGWLYFRTPFWFAKLLARYIKSRM